MKNTFFLLGLIFVTTLAFSQESNTYLTDAQQLIQQKKFASAYAELDSAIRTTGLQPALICAMVDNVLKHYTHHRDFVVFYIKDEPGNGKNPADDKPGENDVMAVRYPDRLLKKSLEQSPQYALTHKLLGDFYRLQLSENKNLKILSPEVYGEIREKVFTNYLRAVQLGYNETGVNLWLGNYYKENNQLKIARQYYQMNIDNNSDDPATYCNLAEIYLGEKKYSQAYNYAIKVLQDFAALDPELRYQATRWAALSLYSLGEEERFLDYIMECIQIFPDMQAAYIDLLAYYDEKHDSLRSHKTIRQMLINNPYGERGYKYLERYCVRESDYKFGEQLFEEMMVLFEHSDEAMGFIYRFRGNLLFHQGLADDAKKLWDISRNYFSRFLPEDSPMLKQIGDISRESSLR